MLADLDGLAAEVEAVRAEAARLSERLERLPAERAAARHALAELEAEAAERRNARRAAEAELAAAERRGDEDRVAAARRTEVRARDLLRSTERRAGAARADEERLAAEEEEIERATERLAAGAQRLAGALADRPGLAEAAATPPSGPLAGVAAWATDARAALFVARGRLAAEREAVIRQANELGTMILGEPLTAQAASLVARRVEQSRPG